MTMNKPVTLPNLDDETVVKISDFLYALLDAFESHYCYQILRYQRNLRTQRFQENTFEDGGEDELPF
jgi:hypothetical protein